jgi:hypothetical protein
MYPYLKKKKKKRQKKRKEERERNVITIKLEKENYQIIQFNMITFYDPFQLSL